MIPVRTLFSSFLLHISKPLSSLRRLPAVDDLIHRVSHSVLPVNHMVGAQVRSGPDQRISIEVCPRTGHLHLTGGAELQTQSVFVQRLRPGDVFYDLGANIGLFSLLAARCADDSGKAFSFEPDAVNAERVRRNAKRNSFSQITVVEPAVWSSTGALAFATADCAFPDRGAGSFLSASASAARTRVRVIALDDFVGDAPRPDGLKFDIEGAEV